MDPHDDAADTTGGWIIDRDEFLKLDRGQKKRIGCKKNLDDSLRYEQIVISVTWQYDRTVAWAGLTSRHTRKVVNKEKRTHALAFARVRTPFFGRKRTSLD